LGGVGGAPGSGGSSGTSGIVGAQGAQGAVGPSYGTPSVGTPGAGPKGFVTVPDDTTANGGSPVTAYGWVIVNIGGTDYYLPAWT
jgi:hypothetical protein